MTLAELIGRRPKLVGEFERLGIDFCCHGERTLAEACAAAGLPLRDALAAVTREEHSGREGIYTANWPELRLADLVDHIEEVHHRYLHLELASLIALSCKVLSLHGNRHPELNDVDRLVSNLRDDFVPHLASEERVVFPAIRELAAGRSGFAFGSIANPTAGLMADHEAVGDSFRELREVTSDYVAPPDACQSYRRLYERLAAVESDTHVHVMKESSFLFPRAVELEAAITEAESGAHGDLPRDEGAAGTAF